MSDVEDLVEVTPIEQLSVDESADQIREIIGLLEDGEVTMGEAKALPTARTRRTRARGRGGGDLAGRRGLGRQPDARRRFHWRFRLSVTPEPPRTRSSAGLAQAQRHEQQRRDQRDAGKQRPASLVADGVGQEAKRRWANEILIVWPPAVAALISSVSTVAVIVE